jgi:hypothetical protein
MMMFSKREINNNEVKKYNNFNKVNADKKMKVKFN